MSLATSDDDDAVEVARRIEEGEVEYEELYRIPASENYPFGTEVGFVMAEGWIVAANWVNDEEGEDILCGHFALRPDLEEYAFPAATQWMITSNSAIDYGLDGPADW